jgi:protein-S-isoprenylcysteine O-methyltransferase Ste14
VNSSTFFRGIFIAIFIAIVILRLYFHRKARTGRENVYSRSENKLTAILRSLIGLSLLISIGVYIIFPQWMSWSALPLPAWLRWIGAGLGVSAVALLFWTHQVLGANFSPTLRIKQDHRLILDGPYRWVRHPMYTALFMLHLAYFFLSANWFIGLTAILVITIVMALRTPEEEALMLARFGDEYSEYMRHTGQFLPRSMR